MMYQHRMAGLAAIEIAQKVSKVWRSLQAEWRNAKKGPLKSGKRGRRRERTIPPSQNRGGACCSTSSSSETSTSNGSLEDRSSSRGMISWQDIYSVAVKWRQISEPCDPVVWVNKLRYLDLFYANGIGSWCFVTRLINLEYASVSCPCSTCVPIFTFRDPMVCFVSQP